MIRVRQLFEDDHLPDPRGVARAGAAQLLDGAPVKAGQSVALTGSSRGIANIALIIAGAVDALKAKGLRPFIVPAMGSHGGGTAERQAAVLHHYGVTEDAVGAPVRSSIETVQLGETPKGIPLVVDRLASEADHLFVINRVKPHTHFPGPCESGLAKILLIGLGKPAGAERYHKAIARLGLDGLYRSAIPCLLERLSVLGGLAIIENARDETARIVPLRAAEILDREPALLEEAKRRMARLPFDPIDLLIVDLLGKDVSGAGMDTNVIGRERPGGPRVGVIFVRDLTPASEGNATGIGMADLTVRRLVEKMDAKATFLNCATALHPHLARVPYAFDTDREALDAAVRCTPALRPCDARIVWIRSTLALAELEASEPLAADLAANPLLETIGDPHPFRFHPDGSLVDAFAPPLG
jgi:hypothetical protein